MYVCYAIGVGASVLPLTRLFVLVVFILLTGIPRFNGELFFGFVIPVGNKRHERAFTKAIQTARRAGAFVYSDMIAAAERARFKLTHSGRNPFHRFCCTRRTRNACPDPSLTAPKSFSGSTESSQYRQVRSKASRRRADYRPIARRPCSIHRVWGDVWRAVGTGSDPSSRCGIRMHSKHTNQSNVSIGSDYLFNPAINRQGCSALPAATHLLPYFLPE